MVFGIIGLVGLCGFGLGILPAILALVLGYQARSDIRASGGTLGGEGNAKAGIVMGWLAVGILVAAVVTVFGFAVAIDHANLG
jgi:hypothetical protein